MITDPEGTIEYVNQGFTQLTGYASGDLLGPEAKIRKLSDTSAGNLPDLMFCLLKSGEKWHGEIKDRKKTGEEYWALETITPIRDALGKVSGFLLMLQDITRQKLDAKALHESEDRFRQIADMVGEWLWEQNAEGQYLYCSAAVEQILGYQPGELAGRNYQELLTEPESIPWPGHKPEPPRLTRPFRKLINHYRHKDGRDVFTESSGAPMLDSSGTIIGWRGMDVDITARKRFEDALRVRDRAIEAANVGISIADAKHPDYPNVYVNPALCRMTGYNRDELMGRSLRLLQGTETEEAARTVIRRALNNGTSCEVLIRNYRKDGSTFWNELLLAPVRDELGTLTHFIGVQTDVSDRLHAEDERRELETAKKIQMSLLPKAPLCLPGIQIAGLCVPATHVGGDYYDFFGNNETIDLVVADVSGHSVGAALIMAEMRSTLKAELRRHHNGQPSTSEILAALNEVLFNDLSSADLFITMFYVRYDPRTGLLKYANAGHNQAIVLRNEGTACELLDAEGLILGVRKTVVFEEKSIVLHSGDRLMLYTDGVTEAQNEAGDFYGLPRLSADAAKFRHATPSETLNRLLQELREFKGRKEIEDDISMVMMQLL